MAGEFQAGLRGTLEALDRMQKLSEARAESPAKRKEYKARELKAEKEIDLAPKLTQRDTAKLDYEIEDWSNKLDSAQMEQAAREILTIPKDDPVAYGEWYKAQPKEFKKRMGLKGPKYHKEDIERLGYVGKGAVNSIPHMRAKELAGIKATPKAKAPKPGDPQYFNINTDGASIKSLMYNHPHFKKLATGWLGTSVQADVFASPEIMAMATEVVNKADQDIYKSYNKAIEEGHQDVRGKEEALSAALDEKLAYLHNNDPKIKDIEFLSPEQAIIQRDTWIKKNWDEIAESIPDFMGMPEVMKLEIAKKIYNNFQQHNYIRKKYKTNTTNLYIEP